MEATAKRETSKQRIERETRERFASMAAHFGPQAIPAMQVAVYVMCGGGMLGNFAADQPRDFYVDTRCGRLPYKVREIEAAVRFLADFAEACGLDPHKMPAKPHFPNLEVF